MARLGCIGGAFAPYGSRLLAFAGESSLQSRTQRFLCPEDGGFCDSPKRACAGVPVEVLLETQERGQETSDPEVLDLIRDQMGLRRSVGMVSEGIWNRPVLEQGGHPKTVAFTSWAQTRVSEEKTSPQEPR